MYFKMRMSFGRKSPVSQPKEEGFFPPSSFIEKVEREKKTNVEKISFFLLTVKRLIWDIDKRQMKAKNNIIFAFLLYYKVEWSQSESNKVELNKFELFKSECNKVDSNEK